MSVIQAALILGAGAVAGMINAVAGGGTILTFPALIWMGLLPINANATSTVALVPGAMAGAWGYREEMKKSESWILAMLVPSFAGGLIGGILLRYTPQQTFKNLVPFLILFATFLFIIQGPVQKFLKTRRDEGTGSVSIASRRWLAYALPVQFLTGIYGGYFGAGMGIMMLATLSLIGFSNLHQMNGLKNLMGSTINLVASAYFVFTGLVSWQPALIMAVGAIIGGYGGAGLAQRLGVKFVRWTVIAIGIGMSVSLLFK